MKHFTVLLTILLCSLPAYGQVMRDHLFDSDWRFYRGEAQGAESPDFPDVEWRLLDLPHDWSIEDLPEHQQRVAELEIVSGKWRFAKGDDSQWSQLNFDDAEWQQVLLPNTWDKHSNYTEVNSIGWYRRRLEIPAQFKGHDIELLLGCIDDADQVWLNGQPIGQTGSFPPNYQTAYDVQRRYRVPASLVKGDGTDLVAVRVYNGYKEGGIYAIGTKSSRIGPFDTRLSQGQGRTGYFLGGTGWYRKQFTLNEPHKRVAIRFDGVYMNADVWINGHHLGFHPYGYTGFEYDLSKYLSPMGVENVLAVRVRNQGKNSRWYSGSGIYRHVWLTVTDAVHIPTGGVFITTPQVTAKEAVVRVQTEIQNDTDSSTPATLVYTIRDQEGKVVAKGQQAIELESGQTKQFEQEIKVQAPQLWSVNEPYNYVTEVRIDVSDQVIDQVDTPFGIRTIEIDANEGLRLNNQPILLRGGCIHHDNGPLGAAAFDRAEERKVELLKANGFNAIRTSHNPPSPALLDACDRIGMLVVVEAFDQWTEQKHENSEDYNRSFEEWHAQDIATMIRRDRNHPSVIMWSIGNEIPEQFRSEDIQHKLREAVLKHDVTRPVTQAICNDWGPVTANWDKLSDIAFKHLDVAGYNYLPEKYESDHMRHPERVIYGAESYPKDALAYWQLVEKHSYVIGDFVWTAVDYLGESGIAHSVLNNEPNPFFMSWPWHNAWCGDLDICGFKKPQSYYRDVVWRQSQIEMAVHTPLPKGTTEVVSWWGWPRQQRSWNWLGHEGHPLKVAVYSRCQSVRLVLNGKVLGEKAVSEETNLTATFHVPYEPGVLQAIGIVDGVEQAKISFETTGEPAAIRLTPDRTELSTSRNDLCYVMAEIVDSEGRLVPHAQLPINFAIDNAGELAGQASGAPNKPASFQSPECLTFQGRCLAIVRPSGTAGTITLKANCDGLAAAEQIIRCVVVE